MDDDRGCGSDRRRHRRLLNPAGRLRPRLGIEGVASLIIRRFTGHRVFSRAAEQRAQKLVAVHLPACPYVAFESVRSLIVYEPPEVSLAGSASRSGRCASCRYWGSPRNAWPTQIGSAATTGEGRQKHVCAYLAGALLVGLLGNALLGAWWLDPIVGLLIAAVTIKEGVEAWCGEGCCVGSPLDGAGFAEECAEGCCAGKGY